MSGQMKTHRLIGAQFSILRVQLFTLYGKAGARAGRKMGHANFLADNLETVLAQVAVCREAYGMPAV